ncbi:antiviral reverse transcriptase Drt3a [Curvivirga sp.]|uniref:antiviral reverse transcriptase Drt3a n=1 Tax=Curvivirga sp. TaxID=2856848 RepID=UPI003B5A1147
MLDQRFSAENLHKSLNRKILIRHQLREDINASKSMRYLRYTTLASSQISKDEFDFPGIHSYKHNRTKTTTYSVEARTGFYTDLALRRLNRTLRGVFKISFSDRHAISKQISSIFQSDFTGTIIKLDIKSFYENVNLNTLQDKLLDDRILSNETKVILRKLFRKFKEYKGLPRGLSISSTLSEYVLRDFDKKIRMIDGIYFYARYVDDIIIFCHLDRDVIKAELECILEAKLTKGLKFNKKEQVIYASIDHKDHLPYYSSIKSVTSKRPVSIDFLGYRYILNNKKKQSNKKQSALKIQISEKKIDRVKRKVQIAIIDFLRAPNIQLLKDRLKFLSGTYPLHQNYKTAAHHNNQLKGGLRFTYPLLNDLTPLRGLDRYLIQRVSTSRIPISTNEFSFLKRFTEHENFTEERIKEIIECWKHA